MRDNGGMTPMSNEEFAAWAKMVRPAPRAWLAAVDLDVSDFLQCEQLRTNPLFANGGEAPYRDDRDVMVPGKRGLFQSQFPKWGRHANEDG